MAAKKEWLLESELALKSVSTSAEIIEERWYEGLGHRTKGSWRDLVTELDIDIEKKIKEILGEIDYKIIGEESTKGRKLDIDSQKPVWFVDPIDGTTNLVSSIPFYSTSVGLSVNSVFPVGAVAVPALKEIFFTLGDKGSFMNSRSLKVASADLKNSLISVGFSGDGQNNDKRKQEYDFFGMLNDKSRGCLRLGSAAVNACYVACGRLQATYAISNKIWDIAGGLAIAQAADCKVYIQWSAESPDISYVIGAPGVAEAIVDFIHSKKLAKLKPIA